MSAESSSTESIHQLMHELRNPLNTISMNAELANLMLQEERDSSEIIVLMERIIAQCVACSGVIDKFDES